jgi:hypothetical protein
MVWKILLDLSQPSGSVVGCAGMSCGATEKEIHLPEIAKIQLRQCRDNAI